MSYIEIRHLIAHTIAKKYTDTNSIIFIVSNKKEWNKQVLSRKKVKETFINREDSHILLNEMWREICNLCCNMYSISRIFTLQFNSN